MRLLVATPLYPPEPGGPATYARLLQMGLPSDGIEVAVVKFADVRSLPKLIRHIAFFWKVFTAAYGVDVVLALDPVSTGLPALWAARLRGKPYLVKVVGDYAWEQGVQRFGIKDSLDDFVRRAHVPFAVRVLRAVQTHVALSAERVIVPSEYLKGIVEAWGIPKSRISVIYNAIELEEGGSVPPEVSSMTTPRIVTVGRLVPWKNIDGIIDAVAELSGDASVVVVGDGPERARLAARAGSALPQRVLFTGALSHAETLAVMKEADIFVLNSSYEGLSHTLIEALMLGKTVIATRAGGNPELITDGENGMLVPVGDTQALTTALKKLIAEPEYAQQLANNALHSSERFSVPAMLKETAKLITSCI